MKTCPKCEIPKDENDFHKCKGRSDGLATYCKSCQKERDATYYIANAEKVKKRSDARNKAYPEERKLIDRKSHLKRKYGLTPDQHAAMLNDQSGVCPGCLEPFPNGPVVDHCHATGAVRGLLCNECNVILGLAKDDGDRLLRLRQYLDGLYPHVRSDKMVGQQKELRDS